MRWNGCSATATIRRERNRGDTMTQLGVRQKQVLEALRKHHHWYKGCGWLYSCHSVTRRIMESLVQRGLAQKAPQSRSADEEYWPVITPIGLREANDHAVAVLATIDKGE